MEKHSPQKGGARLGKSGDQTRSPTKANKNWQNNSASFCSQEERMDCSVNRALLQQ